VPATIVAKNEAHGDEEGGGKAGEGKDGLVHPQGSKSGEMAASLKKRNANERKKRAGGVRDVGDHHCIDIHRTNGIGKQGLGKKLWRGVLTIM